MTRYVLGFAVASSGVVYLIHKARGPEHVVGRWNGIGGKVHDGESDAEAMTREFAEEAGVTIPRERWHRYGSMGGSGWECALFTVILRNGEAPRTVGDEDVLSFAWNSVREGMDNAVENVPVLFALARHALNDGDFSVTLRYP